MNQKKTLEIPRYKARRPSRFSHHRQPGFTTRGRIWVEKDGELYIGWGRAILLERIDELGSLAAAARSMRLGYRNAWLWVEAMNRMASTALVEKTIGGASGGSARLTEDGRKALNHYKELKARYEEFIRKLK